MRSNLLDSPQLSQTGIKSTVNDRQDLLTMDGPVKKVLDLNDSIDFGDLSVARDIGSGCSNAHGGL